ncbi:DUF4114 domain-containing protein [Leptothoe sp. PORK10 BA2]|uniref:DUF4114 domain-containing protein n=1 Tax=Leptothoe sp. PORK10 BA2 TaxID=3110254 RepID=UPI002B1FDCB8|nr:DUF4114 domain-containing protein [Leptothoe sp. PORK10 BA2]MEA5462943.1 DUF4114 domain-containing protein [Leptothoe sp. PORK10 BA2]
MAIFHVTANAPNSNTGASWNTATSLQTALTFANPGDEIWITQGTYTPGNNPNDTFTVNRALKLYGGFSGTETDRNQRDWVINQTILTGSNVNHTVVTTQSTATAALIDGVIIQNGNSNDDGGGVYNQGNGLLTLQNIIVQNNQAADDGGGIRNNGQLTIINSSIINNTALGTSTTSGGGGLLNTVGSLVTVVSSTFSGNSAPNGGGIRNDGTLNFTNSTLSGNTATRGGGGLANTVRLSTSGLPVVVGAATATISHSTVINNKAMGNSGGGIANFGGVTVTSSIIANNVGNDDIADINFLSSRGTTVSGGNNFIGNGGNATGFTNGIKSDQVGTSAVALNPQLGALQANGGFTQTHAPQNASPVIDAGPGVLPIDTFDLDGDGDSAEAIPLDQRGFPFDRIVGTTVDIGAVESQVVPTPAINLTPTTGLITTETGGLATFTAVLASQPANTVTLGFTSDDLSEGTVTPSITFTTTNWNTPQTVTITGVDDGDDDGDAAYIINTSVTSTDTRYSTLLPVPVSVTNQDDDDPVSPTNPTSPVPVTPVPASLTPQGARLAVGGSGDVLIEFSISQNASEQVKEIILFATDTNGGVNGLTPKDPGYLDAVLAAAQVVFSTLESGEIPALATSRTMTATAGTVLQFAVIHDGSLDSLRRGMGGTITLTEVNSQSELVEQQALSTGAVQVGFRQGQTGSFDQLVIKAVVGDVVPIGTGLQGLSPDSELIDLRTETGSLTATIDVFREAALDSVAGLFVVENEQGQVRDSLGLLLNPGDAGYAQAALAQRLDLDLTGTHGKTVSYTAEVLGGQLLSTFLIVDGTMADLLDGNGANDPAIYFTHTLGNRDGTDHVRLLGNNTFGFEDLSGGGDMDFDDVVIQARFA